VKKITIYDFNDRILYENKDVYEDTIVYPGGRILRFVKGPPDAKKEIIIPISTNRDMAAIVIEDDDA
jgi:hypothetical protein